MGAELGMAGALLSLVFRDIEPGLPARGGITSLDLQVVGIVLEFQITGNAHRNGYESEFQAALAQTRLQERYGFSFRAIYRAPNIGCPGRFCRNLLNDAIFAALRGVFAGMLAQISGFWFDP